jgi:DNA modification methylase
MQAPTSSSSSNTQMTWLSTHCASRTTGVAAENTDIPFKSSEKP